jgi:hypothetical protein
MTAIYIKGERNKNKKYKQGSEMKKKQML